MQVPINVIIEEITEKTGLSAEEINQKIADKMEELAGLISEEGAAHIIANELQVSLNQDYSQELKISDIKPFMKNLKITAKIVSLYDLIEFEREGNTGKVRSALIGDDTGVIRCAFWHSCADKIADCKEGDILGLEKVTSKDNNGRSELHLSFDEAITINPSGVEITVSNKMPTPEKKKIAEVETDQVVTIYGVVVQSYNPNFFKSCPECRKRVQEKEEKFYCDVHGEVQPNTSCVLNVVVDDGTGNMRCVCFSENAEKLYGKLITEDSFEKETLIGNIVTLSGKVRYSTYSQKNELVVFGIDEKEE